ncbi:MAG: hypothetical protein KJ050_04260 [Candidatus Omnitrophica bacterium]|nr:MAG: hypothetical protein UZ16_OP3001001358 [Candidatus Hinthialibacteria bacterium OLB16]MCE7907310.1 hypothetical protein [Candidatus Omnitrophica bacterium COP1]MCK6495949.1 hypothetical protein [bacterium]MCL4734128.1 hypothetical protein [Candidatus Omnitrophota bacterium]NUP92478.1 hypothetical protein [Candidatus Omnitrophota bacterium]
MSAVSPVQMSTEAMAQLLAMAVHQSIEQATDLARLNLQLATQTPGGGNPDGVGELVDLYA